MVAPSQDELSMGESRQAKNQNDGQRPNDKIINPPWKKPTRPCPFYSQGQCLFSDSCSFLHDVKVKVRRPSEVHNEDAQDEPGASTKLPLLTGLTIPSESSSLSPTRSPRMTSLLFALKDVIGEINSPEGEHDEHQENPREFTIAPDNGITSHEDKEVVEVESNAQAPVGRVHPTGEDNVDFSLEVGEDDDRVLHGSSSDASLSFADVFSSSCYSCDDDSPHREDSIDSGYGDGFTTVSPMQTSRHPSLPSSLDHISSPSRKSPSVQVHYPDGTHGSVFSGPFSPLTGSASEVAASPYKLYDRSSYLFKRHSHDPAISKFLDDPEGSLSSHQKEKSGSSSSSSLSSLDTLPSSPLDVQTSLTTPENTCSAAATSSLTSKGDPMLQRSRALSELTVVARNLNESVDSPGSPHLEASDIEDETLNLVYGLYNSSNNSQLWSPSVPDQNFSRPSSIISFYEPPSTSASRSPNPRVEGVSTQLTAESPLRGNVSEYASSASVSRSSSTSPSTSLFKRGEKTSGSKVPFGFRHTRPRVGTKTFVKPQPLHLAQWPADSASAESSDVSFDQPSAGLRPLRLSTILGPSFSTSASDPLDTSYAPPSPSVSSDCSISNNRLLSSARSSVIPMHLQNTLVPANDLSPLLLGGPDHTHQLSNLGSPTTISVPQSPTSNNPLHPSIVDYRHSFTQVQSGQHERSSSTLSAIIYPEDEEDELMIDNYFDETIRNPIGPMLQSTSSRSTSTASNIVFTRDNNEYVRHSAPGSRSASIRRVPIPDLDNNAPHSAPISRTTSRMTNRAPIHCGIAMGHTYPTVFTRSPTHAIATPRPTLMFAIASDSVEEVERVLESGEVGPNDQVGPQSALEFALTNDRLLNKMDIVKTLLGHGADPSMVNGLLQHPSQLTTSPLSDGNEKVLPLHELEVKVDPATRYFIARADAPQTRRTSALIHRSFFRPLTRMRYDVIGQDCAFEQLFRVLSIHSHNLSVSPVVVLLCGPSGHGKSLLARKFGSLLNVPTHTVNMTTLKSTHDLWQSYSMSPYEEPSMSTLAEFLTENEGKRCVVVLDEIDKIVDEKALWSLLMPWELGRCSFEAGQRHVNVRNTIWLGTSNTGNELVFEYQSQRTSPDSPMDQQEYANLVALFRPDVSQCLGPSLVSRVTTILPFIPFTTEEKMAIATQALFSLGGEMARSMSPMAVESFVSKALNGYLPPEGARSLYRAVSTQLLDALDSV